MHLSYMRKLLQNMLDQTSLRRSEYKNCIPSLILFENNFEFSLISISEVGEPNNFFTSSIFQYINKLELCSIVLFYYRMEIHVVLL